MKTENGTTKAGERTQHTLGPWNLTQGELGTTLVDGICMVYGSGKVPTANANLIAAAPELLDALKPFLIFSDALKDSHSDDDVIMTAHNPIRDFLGLDHLSLTVGHVRDAIAAIAKAEGRA